MYAVVEAVTVADALVYVTSVGSVSKVEMVPFILPVQKHSG